MDYDAHAGESKYTDVMIIGKLQALGLLDTFMAVIDNALLTLFKIFKQDGSLLTCILHYHVNSSHISVMSDHFVPYKSN